MSSKGVSLQLSIIYLYSSLREIAVMFNQARFCHSIKGWISNPVSSCMRSSHGHEHPVT